MTAVLFVGAAAVGAALRHQVNRAGWAWRGTLAINVVGAFALGWLLAGNPSTGATMTVGTGLLGSFTTFSSFALEASTGGRRQRITVIGATLALGLAAVAAGHALG